MSRQEGMWSAYHGRGILTLFGSLRESASTTAGDLVYQGKEGDNTATECCGDTECDRGGEVEENQTCRQDFERLLNDSIF